MLEQMGIAAKAASYKLAQLSSREKNQVLEKIADYLEAQTDAILRANAEDLAEARANGLSEALLDRLALNPARLSGIAHDVRQVCNLADPVGQVIDGGLLLAFFYLVVIGTALTFSLYLKGAQMIGGPKASILSCAEPLSSALLSVVLLGVAFTLPDWLGTLLIVSSVVLISMDSRRRVKASA